MSQSTKCAHSSWSDEIEGFGNRAVMIRRLLARFQSEDVTTRRYLRRYIDEEWRDLQSSFEALREKFGSLERH